MKKLLLMLTAIFGSHCVAFADHHGKENGFKDVEEVTNTVLKMYEMVNNNKNWTSMISSKGSHEFWSSGGFLNFVKKDANFNEIEKNTIRPKHIKIVPVEPGKVAVAMFYAEGSEKQGREACRGSLHDAGDCGFCKGGRFLEDSCDALVAYVRWPRDKWC
jgi:hypothetical protein